MNAAGRHPQDDRGGEFSFFETPQALAPAGSPARRSRRPGPPRPADPVDALLWLAAGEGASLRPWLPLPEDQDRRWQDVRRGLRARPGLSDRRAVPPEPA